MGKGLKQLVEEAVQPETKAALPPIEISPEARRALSERVRLWSGWRNASLAFGPTDPKVSPIATTDHAKRLFTIDPEMTLLNPNRVLLTVTPFRMRQEAVLTGALLHEAGHARHSLWLPRNSEEFASFLHSDGAPVTKQVVALARLVEEPRVEALMARDADNIGAVGLGWTMRAMAAHLMPTTQMSMDPSQALMDLITSWTLRAGRQAGLNHYTKHPLPGWVRQFTSLVHKAIENHLTERADAGADLGGDTPNYRSMQVLAALNEMIQCTDDTGPTMIDLAREALRLLFPETPEDDDSDAGDGDAMPGGACGAGVEGESEASAPEDNEGEGDESGADGEGNTEPEDEGSGDEPGAGDSGSDEADADEDQSEEDSTADESDEQDQAEADNAPEEDKPGDGGSEAEEEAGATDSTSALAKALAEMEAAASNQTEAEAENEASKAPPMEDTGGKSGGSGPGGNMGGGWRAPDKDEREVSKGAERFLRDMIDASESAKRMLTDQPSAAVDGAALSAWKAGGQVREPHFFVRTRRTVEPSPPIQIAILVDVSASMDELQKPSALLSWSLASAALDLRNFAGRGQQVESCLIHWGDSVKTIQAPGQTIPGIREVQCNQGTSNMHGAIDRIEEVMPGFFDMGDQPVNRLLVQFTDWKVFHTHDTAKSVGRALESGVNMLSVVPNNYSHRWTPLNDILRLCPIQRGATSMVKYNPGNPQQVWDQAATALSGGRTSMPSDEAAQFGF